jgi:hypothetical protein
MTKRFVLEISDDAHLWHDLKKIAVEAALTGIYVLRTSVGEEALGPADVVSLQGLGLSGAGLSELQHRPRYPPHP